MPWVTGPLFGLFILLSELYFRRQGVEGDVIRYAVTSFSFVFRMGVFGFIFPLAMRDYMRRVYEGLYNGEDWIFERPEGEEHFRYRMPAARIIGSNRAVSGVLHLGPPGLLFVPNRKSSAKHKPVELAPIGGIALRIVDPPPQTLRQKIFIPNPQRLLEFSAGSQTVCFQVPLVDDTAERLSGFLRILQADEAES